MPVLVLCTEPLTLPLPDLEGSDAVADVASARFQTGPSSWQITRAHPQVTRELTGISGAVPGRGLRAVLVLDPGNSGDRPVPLMSIETPDGVSHPVYVELKRGGGSLFLAGFAHTGGRNSRPFGPEEDIDFVGLVPLLTFLRFAAGPYCWHREPDYANLTIDDPWLTEPYGYLSYRGLLAEMKKAGFHTTIAFIPWNYDRSEQNVVTIFRDNPAYYSLCVHGNNHDHWEFYRYRVAATDPRSAKPLRVQEANIRQGLARMERLRQLTGLESDCVMVFPHCTPPLPTYTLLKKYNFLMTVNSECEPLDLDPPADPVFRLRPLTLCFGNFASLVRHTPAGRSRAEIALDLFVDNPVIFFEHHTLFRRGIDAFHETAEMVNAIGPGTEWVALGDIARHLYLQRRRLDGNWDVKVFSRSIELINTQPRELTCFVEKEETSDVPIREVLVNGIPHPYAVADGRLRLAVAVEPRRPCRIDIRYENDFDASQVDVAKNDPHINRLRALSDLRDRTLARCRVARTVVGVYYASGLYRLGLAPTAVLCGALGAALVMAGWKLSRRGSRGKPRPTSNRSNAAGR